MLSITAGVIQHHQPSGLAFNRDKIPVDCLVKKIAIKSPTQLSYRIKMTRQPMWQIDASLATYTKTDEEFLLLLSRDRVGEDFPSRTFKERGRRVDQFFWTFCWHGDVCFVKGRR